MECSNCGSPSAKIHTRVVGGVEKKVCLCLACYDKLYSKADVSEGFARYFGKAGDSAKKSKSCPSCGMTIDKFRNSGLLGCAGCYSAFRSEIYDSLRYCQWDFEHHGKVPVGTAEEKYDMVRQLVREQEFVKEQFDKALRKGDVQRMDEFKRRLQEIRDKLTRAGEV